MTVNIISISDRYPQYIEYQFHSIKKHVKDNNIKYTIFNNASEKNVRNEINETCRKLNINCIELFGDYSLVDGSLRHVQALNTIWQQYVKDMSGNLFWIDGDMFFVSDINIEETFKGCQVGYSPVYRNDFKIECMWSGILFFDLDAVDRNIDFKNVIIDGVRTDAGGKTYYYLREHYLDYKYTYFRVKTIYDFNDEKLETELNNCCRITIDGKSFNTAQQFSPEHSPVTRIFPHEKIKSKYAKYYSSEYNEHKKLIQKYGFPKPYTFDLINIEDDKTIIFHCRGASWMDMYGNGKSNYAHEKEMALRKMLGIDDEIK